MIFELLILSISYPIYLDISTEEDVNLIATIVTSKKYFLLQISDKLLC